MQHRKPLWILLIGLFALTLSLPMSSLGSVALAQDATPTPAAEEETADEADAPTLATASAYTQLSNQFGRAIVSARTNHFIIDSAPPLGHPSEETNPVEAMLAALATCGVFVYEAAAAEMDIPLESISAAVHGDFDVTGLSGASEEDPRVQAFRVHIDMEGPSEEEATTLAEQWKMRCPIYTTLIKSAPIELTVNDEEMGDPVAEGLATAKVVASLTNQPGRALVQVRDNYIVVDSVPPLNGPNLEVNPLDLLLAAQGTCGTFIMEKAALDNDIPFHGAAGTVEVDFDPRGLRDGSVSPHVQQMRVHWEVGAETEEDAEFLVDEWLARCPIYNTLIRATDIEVSHELMGEGTAVLVTSFTFDLEADDYVAEVSPLADAFAALDGLVWKIWTLNEEDSRGGGIFLFEDAEARQAFIDGELFGMVQAHPALSDFKVEQYDIVRAESLATNGPLMAAEASGDEVEAGEILQITFTYNVSTEDFMAEVSPLAEDFAAAEGLNWKLWSIDEANSQFSGILYFEDTDSVEAFLDSDLAETITTHPALSDFEITRYGVMVDESLMTNAPIE